MISYEQFIRKFGVRTTNQLTQPPLPQVTRMMLPLLSVTHYLGGGGAGDTGPTQEELLYQGNQKPIRISHVFELAALRGNPRPDRSHVTQITADFRRHNPRFRPAVEIEQMKREPQNILTFNYANLQTIYRYQRTMFTYVNRWQNIWETVYAKSAPMLGQGINQFIELTIPKTLPSVQELDIAARGWTALNMPRFASPDLIFLVHLWKWLGVNREQSELYKYWGDDAKGMHLVLREGDRFCIVNLELLSSWRKSSMKEIKFFRENFGKGLTTKAIRTRGIEPATLQKRFLRLMMSVMQARSGDVPENLGDEEVIDKAATTAPEATVGRVDSEESTVSAQTTMDPTALSEQEAFDGYDEESDLADFDAELEKDLEILAELKSEPVMDPNAMLDQGEEEAEDGVSPQPSTVEDTVIDLAAAVSQVQAEKKFPVDVAAAARALCIRAADAGAMTVPDYRRYMETIENFGKLPAPLGHPGTMADFVKVSPETLAITEPPSIPDRPTIIDKSMLESTLIDFDARYVKNVMQKDIAAMATSIQRAGVLVRDYQVREVETVLGTHHEILISVKPLEGMASNIPVRIPKVDEDGNFRINGVTYKTRKQRGDMPIRKIGSDRVALTSYYGKVFVERSQRRVNDYGKWIQANIRAAGLSAQDERISKLVTGNAFNPDTAVRNPRAYSAIAQGFRSFDWKIGEDVFHCSFMGDIQRLRISGGGILLGKNEAGAKSLYMDYSGNLFTMNADNTLQEIGGVEEALGLPSTKAPVEFAELLVFGKLIPVGVVLGYLLGLDKVLAMFKKAIVREVPTGTRLSLQSREWAMVFDDKALVFSRDDALATMVLGGWRDYQQVTSTFACEEFNQKDVYYNVLESKKLNARYLREMDLLEQMFVDPITRDLLIEMKEPTVFTDLLLRSADLLTTDEHPNEQDTRFMRIKGYERFAGAVYAELVRAIRIHNGRPGKQRFSLEVKPYAVWTAIQQDPAKDQVSEINPVQNMKEKEAVTYSGTGGRSSRSMVKSTRVFHKNDTGVISESTVDSGDVAINVFTSANPRFTSLRGTTDGGVTEADGVTSLLSTSALLSPGATRDD